MGVDLSFPDGAFPVKTLPHTQCQKANPVGSLDMQSQSSDWEMTQPHGFSCKEPAENTRWGTGPPSPAPSLPGEGGPSLPGAQELPGKVKQPLSVAVSLGEQSHMYWIPSDVG